MRMYFLALPLMLASQLAAAGELYRIVGPDGKVSYSDRPQTTSGAPASVQAVKVPGTSKPASDYTIVDAVSRVMGMGRTVEHLTKFCGKHVPKTSPAVRAARDDWQVRNNGLAVQQAKVARDMMSPGQLQQLTYAMEDESRRLEGIASQAAPEMKATWCADAARTFTARELDPSRDLALTRVLMGYKFSKQ